VQLFGREFLPATDVILIVRISTVDDDVTGLEQRQQLRNRGVHVCGRHHQPDRTRLRQLGYEIRQAAAPDCAFGGELAHAVCEHIEDDALMAVVHQTSDHVPTHPTETYHSELHELYFRGSA